MRVLLVSQWKWHGPARFPKALKEAGFEVAAVCGKGEWIANTRYVDKFYLAPTWEERPFLEFLIVAIESWHPDLILFATDNMVLAGQELRRLVESNQAKLSSRMVETLRSSTFDPAHEGLLHSKFDLLEALKERGVRIPAQRELNTLSDADSFVQEHGYPVLLKPDFGFAGSGIMFCHTEEELLKNLNKVLFGKNRQRYAIQKYLGNKTALIEFVAKDGKVLCHQSAQRMHTHPGETGPVTVLRTVESTEMLKAAEAMCDLLRYNGIGVPQFVVEDDSCESALLLELNPRMSHFPHVWAKYGNNFAETLRKGWSGESVVQNPPRLGETIALWPQEAIRDPESSYLANADFVTDDPGLRAIYDGEVARAAQTS
ncbi:MAG: ATP-grasp domain-containing protein [Chlorobia bacterium]|nr:ATP-grasp domain-containing protein [Fimbriimonadaceae bacterium]